MKKTHALLALIIAVAMLMGTACGSTKPTATSGNTQPTSAPIAASGTIKIGAILPLTGASAHEGGEMHNAAQLAMNEVNALGGISGKKLEIIFEDDEDTPQPGIDAAHKLIDVNQVPVIIGSFSSGVTLPIAQYANQKGVVVINPGSTSPKLAEVGPYLFSTIGLDNLMGTEVANFALSEGMKKCAILIPNNQYGLGMEEYLNKAFTAGGGEIVAKVEYTLKQTDYRAELERLFVNKPECVLYSAYGEESKVISRQVFEMGVQVKWYDGYVDMCTAVADPTTVQGHKGLEPAMFIPEAVGFRARYKTAFGAEPTSSFSLYTYDAVWLAALTMGMVGTNPADIQKGLPLAAIHYRGASGAIEFDANGQRLSQVYQELIFTGTKLELYQK